MNNIIRAAVIITVISLAWGSAAEAQQEATPNSRSGLALTAKVGTLGAGGDVTLRLHRKLNLRINGNYFRYLDNETIDDIDYEAEVDFNSFIGMLDWHPFANGLRISGGVIMNNNEIVITGTPTESETIGGNTYTPAQIGTLEGNLTFDNSAPYIGIGFGNAVGRDKRWGFNFDLGVLLQTLEADLKADGLLALDPQFQQDLAEEEEDIQEELDSVEIYPVLAFGISYQF